MERHAPDPRLRGPPREVRAERRAEDPAQIHRRRHPRRVRRQGPYLGHRLIDEGSEPTRREKVERNEPAGIRTHDCKRTGVKRPDLDTNLNIYLTKLIFVGMTNE